MNPAPSVRQANEDSMCRKILSTVVAILAVNLLCNPLVRAQSRNLSTDEVRAQISKLGTGPKALVRITLKDKRKMQGWLSLVADDHFSVTDGKSGRVTEIKYADVAGIKNLKPSHGAIIIGAVAVISLAAVIFLFAGAKH